MLNNIELAGGVMGLIGLAVILLVIRALWRIGSKK